MLFICKKIHGIFAQEEVVYKSVLSGYILIFLPRALVVLFQLGIW